MHTLNIKILDTCPNKDYVEKFYSEKISKLSYQGDCGIDLIFPDDVTFVNHRVTKCGLGIACEFFPNGDAVYGPYDLVPRSSIVNTPLMLANSIGIIDPGYRGEIIAAFRCFSDKNIMSTIDDFEYKVEKGTRLVQIVSPDRKPIRIILTNQLSETDRGAGGFGSTGTK